MSIQLLSSKIISGILVLVVGYLAISSIRVHSQKKEVMQSVADLKAKIEVLTKEKQLLEKQAAYLHDPQYLELQAREKLNYRAADEKVVVVYQETNAMKPSSASSGESSGGMARLANWLYDVLDSVKGWFR